MLVAASRGIHNGFAASNSAKKLAFLAICAICLTLKWCIRDDGLFLEAFCEDSLLDYISRRHVSLAETRVGDKDFVARDLYLKSNIR